MARLFQQHIIDLSLVVISSMFIGIAVGALTTRPKNVAVGWNQTAVLNCTNQGVDVFWFNTSCDFSVRPIHCPVSNLVFDSLQITTSVSSRMSISSGHTKDLLISPQYPFDATEYFCVDAASCCDASSAQLVVMGSDVSCNISNCCNFTVGDTISISCDFQYEGKMTHFVHCKANDIFLFSGSLNASIAATENLNSTRINCTAYFEPKQQPTSPYCANNTVLTEYVYMSSQITVNPTTTVTDEYSSPSTGLTNGDATVSGSNYVTTDVSSTRSSEVTKVTGYSSSSTDTTYPQTTLEAATFVSNTTPNPVSQTTVIAVATVAAVGFAGTMIAIVAYVSNQATLSTQPASKPNVNADIQYQHSPYSERPTTFVMYQAPYYKSGVFPVRSYNGSYGGRITMRGHPRDLSVNAYDAHVVKTYNRPIYR